MEILENIPTDQQSLLVIAGVIVVGLLLLFVAIKISKFIIKLAMFLIVAASLAGAVWWYFLRNT